MTRPPHLLVALDPADDHDTHHRLIGLRTGDHATVTVELRPNARRLYSVVQDILAALGKDPNRRGADRNAQESWDQATAWLLGQETRRLIVTRCHTMPTRYIEPLVELATLTGADLTLVYGAAALNRGTRDTLKRLLIPIVPLAESPLASESRETVTNDEEPPDDIRRVPPVIATLPDDDFSTFYAAAARELDPVAFTAFDETYRAAAAHVHTTWPGNPTPDGIAELLRTSIDDANDMTTATIRARAAQAACLLHGYLLNWRPGKTSIAPTASAGDADALGRLRRYASTRHAALGVIALAAPATTLDKLADIRLNDVNPNDLSVTIAGRTVAIPAAASGIVKSHVYRRLIAGASEKDGLIQADTRAMRHHRDGQVCSPTTIRRLLRDIEAETGLPVVARWNARKPETAATWARRRGFSIKPLPALES